jgi:hypothetical protein
LTYLCFLTEGKLAAIFIKTFSWGLPTGRSFTTSQQVFWHHHHCAISISYGNSSNNNGGAPSDLEVMLKDFISKQASFNKSVDEKLGKIDVLASKVDSLALDVELLKLICLMM